MKRTYLLLGGLVVVLALISVVISNGGVRQLTNVMPTMMEAPFDSAMKGDAVSIGQESMGIAREEMMGYVPSVPYIGGGNALDVDQRQYETYASYTVVVKDVNAYLNSLRDIYLGMQGRVLQLSTGSSGKYQTGYMTAKVPVASFDTASQEATKGIEKIVNQSVNSLDVTGVSVSLAEQIAKLEDQRAQKELDLLEAKTDAEKRRIQVEINRLQTQIDSFKKQQQSQQEQVQYATISVSAASSERVYNSEYRPDLMETLRDAVDSVISNLFVVAQFFIWAAVYALVIAPAFWLLGKLKQKRAEKNSS